MRTQPAMQGGVPQASTVGAAGLAIRFAVSRHCHSLGWDGAMLMRKCHSS